MYYWEFTLVYHYIEGALKKFLDIEYTPGDRLLDRKIINNLS
ncbi:hypothetical protein CLCAR_3042 [Clostridium carboxidivorans P7]|nr:hypothetical protein CLCAR_3042 [Clostridium carboxidivorans P7]